MALAMVYLDGTWAKRTQSRRYTTVKALFPISIGMNHLKLHCLSGHITKVVQFHSGATALGGMSFSAVFRCFTATNSRGGLPSASERISVLVEPVDGETSPGFGEIADTTCVLRVQA